MASTDHELLDQVDEADRVIGSCRRGDAHRLGLRHRAVHILVFNSADEIFLQKRSMLKDINPGLWDTSSAGHVDCGESYDDCARRELREELGIEGPDPEFLFKLPAASVTGWEFVHVYRTWHNGELLLNAEEIEEGCWMAPDRLDHWIEHDPNALTTALQTLWKTYRYRD